LKVPFRQAYAKPATVARARVGEMGKEYEPWSLPSVRIRSKMLKD